MIGAITPDSEPELPEVSVVIPCLNEAETLGSCIDRAASAMREHGIAGEIIVADNGSFDESQTIARGLGAVVVEVASKGYGNALMGGIAAARGRFIVMGDADASTISPRSRSSCRSCVRASIWYKAAGCRAAVEP